MNKACSTAGARSPRVTATAQQKSAADLKAVILNELTISIPDTGQALGISRNAAYEAANRGDFPVIDCGKLKRVPTSWLRKQLGLEAA